MNKINSANSNKNIFDEVISANNVKEMGEWIAYKSLRLVMNYSGKALDSLYNNYISDLIHFDKPDYIVSSGYDIAQTAICFLCGYIGKHITDICCKDKTGKPISIKSACYSVVNKYLHKEREEIYETEPYTSKTFDTPIVETNIEFDEEDYQKVESIIDRMRLTELERNVLPFFDTILNCIEIAKECSTSRAIVYRIKDRIKIKYNTYIATTKA